MSVNTYPNHQWVEKKSIEQVLRAVSAQNCRISVVHNGDRTLRPAIAIS
jgi:hypothetical protein